MAEYSYVPLQTVGADENLQFTNGTRICRKGYIQHRENSGIFFLKGATNSCKAVYSVTFNGNVALAAGATVEPVSVAFAINGETLGNATAVVTPAAVGEFFNVSISTFVDVPCDCCLSVTVENASATADIDVTNANIIFERVA